MSMFYSKQCMSVLFLLIFLTQSFTRELKGGQIFGPCLMPCAIDTTNNNNPHFSRIEFWWKLPTMLTCPSSGMLPESRCYPISEADLVDQEAGLPRLLQI